VGGTGGRARGHWGIVVELEDGTAAPDEDPRQTATRSTPTAAVPNGARCLLVLLQPTEEEER
jgi:hypothetical protein